MKHINLLALGALAILSVLAVVSQADALQSTRTFKQIQMTFVVTPSPAPIVFHRSAPAPVPERGAPAPASIAQTLPAAGAPFAQFADAFRGPAQIASSGAVAWDVPPGGVMIAQTVQPPPVPVRFNAKADPTAAFLRIIPQFPPPDSIFHVPYGTTRFACAFQIFTYYPTAHTLTDWGYGTVLNGGTPTFPVENYPTPSYLSWVVPDFTATALKAYANSGAPGEKTWTGRAGQSQQHCVDISITVPDTQASNTAANPYYYATIQYNLIVT
ncbi:MAG: hypothetical protein NVS3B7_04820 [Candidatus Elarobacter sp.]